MRLLLSTQLKRTEKTAKTVDEAIELALAELGATKNQVEIEVLDEGSKGLFGILGGTQARVIVTKKDSPANKATAFLSDLFLSMGIRVQIDADFDGDTLNINLSGNDMGIIIGKRGDTLDSIQYLTSLVVNSGKGSYIKVTIDTENYREKRKEALEALAVRIANKVERTGRRHTFEPMNPYERRIIHSKLQAYENVTTYSIGEDPNRKLVVMLKEKEK